MKNAIQGMAVSVLGAYVYAVLIIWNGDSSSMSLHELFVTGPLFALSYTFWFIIPLGAAVGILIPKNVRGVSRGRAILYGLGFAVVVGGCVTIILLALELPQAATLYVRAHPGPWWDNFLRHAVRRCVIIILYSAPWTVAYAYLSRRPRQLSVSHTNDERGAHAATQ